MATRSWTLSVLLLCLACAPALAAPATVQLRVEGEASTVYEGPVTTDGHRIRKDESGEHPCDGTNGNANPRPGPTMTSALDDAERAGRLTWDGTWFDSFEDFTIDRVGPDRSTDNKFWGHALNYDPSQAGGCQRQVAPGDEVLFAYDFFSKDHLLRLSGPARARRGESFAVRVVDGRDGSAIGGAEVEGRTTGNDGRATLSYDSAGVRRLKASRSDSVRSNALVVCVYESEPSECDGTSSGGGASTGAAGPPVARLSSPGRIVYRRRGPRLLRGIVDAPRGIHGVYLRIRWTARGGCRWYSARREGFTKPRTCRSARFFRVGDRPEFSYLLPERPARGRYVVELKALDRTLARAVSAVRFTVR